MNAFSHSLSSSALLRSLSALLLIAACALPTGASAQLSSSNSSLVAPATGSVAASQVKTDQVVAELVVHAPDGVTPGKTLWLGLLLQHQPHWHTYWKNPGDSGLPTQLQWTLPAGLTAGDIAWPVPRKIAIGTLAN
ncbi:MAG: protein-disulfide reductase, partial [Betaproteobacteria bacterium]|nr:protein-disulfide reductase [Betaproteobacteria bacterium]